MGSLQGASSNFEEKAQLRGTCQFLKAKIVAKNSFSTLWVLSMIQIFSFIWWSHQLAMAELLTSTNTHVSLCTPQVDDCTPVAEHVINILINSMAVDRCYGTKDTMTFPLSASCGMVWMLLSKSHSWPSKDDSYAATFVSAISHRGINATPCTQAELKGAHTLESVWSRFDQKISLLMVRHYRNSLILLIPVQIIKNMLVRINACQS